MDSILYTIYGVCAHTIHMRLVYMICLRTFTYVYMVFTYTYTYVGAFVFIMLQAHVSTQYPNKQTADKE